MPITKSAIKALRRDKRRANINKPIKTHYQTTVKKTRLQKTSQNLKKAYSTLDTAAKKGVIHKKGADRLKSRLAKIISQKEKSSTQVKKSKKSKKKQKK